MDPLPVSTAPSRSVRIAAWLILVALTLLILEIGARTLFPGIEVENFNRGNYTPEVVKGVFSKRNLAHASFLVDSALDNTSSLHQLNLYGFRDQEWSLAKTHNRRIFVIGDSMTEGFLVTEKETIPRVLETLLRQAGESVEVWNLGVGASGPGEYAALVQDAVPVFRPDEIQFVFHVNDLLPPPVFPNPSERPAEVIHRGMRLRLLEVVRDLSQGKPIPRRWHQPPFMFFPAVPDPQNPWTQHEQELSRQVAPEVARAMREGRLNPFNVDEAGRYAYYLKRPADMRPWLTRMKSYLDSQHVPFRITLIPQVGQASDHYRPYKLRMGVGGAPSLMDDSLRIAAFDLARVCHDLGIPFLDTTEILRAEEVNGHRMYWNYDEHMTAQGYAVVANAIARFRKAP